MTLKSLSTLAIRLLAVYVFAASSIYFPTSSTSFVQSLSQSGLGIPTLLFYLLGFLFSALLIPLIIWVIAPWLAGRMTNDGGHSNFSQLSPIDFLRLGLVLIGLVFLPTALAQFLSTAYAMSSNPPQLDLTQRFMFDQGLRQTLISSGIKILVAGIFICCNSRIARIIEKATF